MSFFVVAASIFSALFSPDFARAEDTTVPTSLAIIGDSKDVGILADTSVGQNISPIAKTQMESLAAALHLIRLKERLTSGGSTTEPDGEDTDAETRARADLFYKLAFAFQHHALSAFGGNGGYSIKSRLQRSTGGRIAAFNQSIAAGSAGTMGIQLDRVARQAAWTSPSGLVDFFVVDIGSVDFLARSKPEKFAADYLEGLDALIAHNPDARFLILKIPDVPAMLALPDQVGYRFFFQKEMCSAVRVRLGFAAMVEEDLARDPVGTRARLAQMNGFLDTLPDRMRAQHPELRMEVMDYPIPDASYDGMAADCFHPNERGNKILAERAWPVVQKLYPALQGGR